jgi:hypothetical protein
MTAIFIAPFPLSASHSHPSGYPTWVGLESRLPILVHDQSFPDPASRASFFIFLSSFVTHICTAHILIQPKSTLFNSHFSLPLVTTFSFCSFAGGGNRSARRKPPVRGPSRNFIFRCDIIHVSMTGIEARTAACHRNIGHLSGVLTRQPRTPQTTHPTNHSPHSERGG